MIALVIPDVHLQDWMFCMAHEIIETSNIDKVVVLGDVVDSHENGKDLSAYERTKNTTIEFARKHSDKLIWLYGNHEIGYIEPGCTCRPSNYDAYWMVHELLGGVEKALGVNSLSIAARLDTVIFSHAGIADIKTVISHTTPIEKEWDTIIERFNKTRYRDLWEPNSPIWYRPSDYILPYFRGGCLQVAGHNPSRDPYRFGNILYTDTFHKDCAQVFPIVDTETQDVIFLGPEFKEYTYPNLVW